MFKERKGFLKFEVKCGNIYVQKFKKKNVSN